MIIIFSVELWSSGREQTSNNEGIFTANNTIYDAARGAKGCC